MAGILPWEERVNDVLLSVTAVAQAEETAVQNLSPFLRDFGLSNRLILLIQEKRLAVVGPGDATKRLNAAQHFARLLVNNALVDLGHCLGFDFDLDFANSLQNELRRRLGRTNQGNVSDAVPEDGSFTTEDHSDAWIFFFRAARHQFKPLNRSLWPSAAAAALLQ